MTTDIATVALPDGERIPKLGLGTWEMGERAARRGDETAALREGIALGMTLVDTAEMYGDGATETLVGEALRGRSCVGRRRDPRVGRRRARRRASRRWPMRAVGPAERLAATPACHARPPVPIGTDAASWDA